MKIVNKSTDLLRLAAATKLRQRGFEVYALPVTPMRHLPDLVAFRSGRFYNVYLCDSTEDRADRMDDETRRLAFEYAELLGATVATMVIRLVVRG